MEPKLEQIREHQQATWNKFSPMWKKWDDLLMKTLKPVGDEMIGSLNLKNSMFVLDIASGTGEPGLSLAAKLKNGKVLLTDLSENMLKIAQEKARKRNVTNIEIRVCNACELPFPDNTFDAISCRLGFMFFPDMAVAAKEMHRVLKPGGGISTSVWNVPDKNPWATTIAGTIMRQLQLPLPPPEAPGLFRCAKSGLVQELFQHAGFKKTTEKEIAGTIKFDNIEVYWNMITQVTPPLVAALNQANAKEKENIKKEVFQYISQNYPEENLVFNSSILLIYGEK